MKYFRNLDEIAYILIARTEQAKSVAAEAQAESLQPGLKPLVLKASKGSIER